MSTAASNHHLRRQTELTIFRNRRTSGSLFKRHAPQEMISPVNPATAAINDNANINPYMFCCPFYLFAISVQNQATGTTSRKRTTQKKNLLDFRSAHLKCDMTTAKSAIDHWKSIGCWSLVVATPHDGGGFIFATAAARLAKEHDDDDHRSFIATFDATAVGQRQTTERPSVFGLRSSVFGYWLMNKEDICTISESLYHIQFPKFWFRHGIL